MTRYKYLIENREVVNVLVDEGFIDASLLVHLEIYKDFDESCTRDVGRLELYDEIAKKHKRSRRTVELVLNKLTKKLQSPFRRNGESQ